MNTAQNKLSMGWKLSKQRTKHQLFYIFHLLIICTWNLAKLMWLVRQKSKEANENATPLRPLSGLVFACIMNRNECSVLGKNVIFKTFMNIWSTVDCISDGYKQIAKPTFDLRQALDRFYGSHVPQTTVVRIFALWRLFKGVLWRCETSEDNCQKTYR